MTITAQESDVLTARELAILLRVSLPTVYAMAASGELPGQRIGTQWRFSRSAIEERLRSR